MRQKPKVTVLEFHGRLAIIPRDYAEDVGDGWWPTGGQKLGCVLGDTKTGLACSEEALALMERIPKGRDAIGDLDWWACNDGTFALSWWGPIHRLMTVEEAVSARGFRARRDQCRIVPNEIPPDVLGDLQIARFQTRGDEAEMWREPFAIEPSPYPERA